MRNWKIHYIYIYNQAELISEILIFFWGDVVPNSNLHARNLDVRQILPHEGLAKKVSPSTTKRSLN